MYNIKWLHQFEQDEEECEVLAENRTSLLALAECVNYCEFEFTVHYKGDQLTQEDFDRTDLHF